MLLQARGVEAGGARQYDRRVRHREHKRQQQHLPNTYVHREAREHAAAVGREAEDARVLVVHVLEYR